jgi:hypothetical protein
VGVNILEIGCNYQIEYVKGDFTGVAHLNEKWLFY